MKRRLRLIAIPVLVLVLCVVMCIPAFAAKPTVDDIGYLVIGTSNDDAQLYTAVCIKEDGENYVYCSIRPISQQIGQYKSIIGKETVDGINEAYNTGNFQEWKGGMYRGDLGEAVGIASQTDVFPEMGSVKKNDTVYFTYLHETDYKVEKSTVKSISKGVLTTKDELEEELSSQDFVVVFNEASEVVALCKNGTAYVLDSSDTPNLIVIIIAAAAALVVIIVVLILILNNNKKKKQQQPVAPRGVSGYEAETTIDDGYYAGMGGMGEPTMPCGVAACRLIGRGGVMNGRTYQVGPGGATIGRNRDNSIAYPEQTPGVSRQHLKLFWDSNGQLMLMDVGSSNGTYVDRMGKLTPMVPVPLSEGSVFYVGEQRNGFQVTFR